jgi:hypothetical protein
MRKCNWRRKIACVFAAAMYATISHASPILIGGANPTTYTQSFDSLSSTEPGTAPSNSWTDDSTISGWYMSNANAGTPQTLYRASPPSSFNATGNMSLGPNGSSDRALGGRGNDSRYAVLLKNTSGATIDQVNVSYLVELWRTGATGSQDAMGFASQVMSSAPASTPTTSGTFTSVPSMTATFGDPTTGFSPGDTNSTVGATHPYVPATSINNTLTGLGWADGQFLMLEWIDHNNTLIAGGGANDAALGIDDVNLSAVISTAPEPASAATIALAALSLIRPVRRR